MIKLTDQSRKDFQTRIDNSILSDQQKQKYSAMLKTLKKDEQFTSLVLEFEQTIESIQNPLTEEEKSQGTPREQAEKITEGKDSPHFIGRKSREVLEQNIMALKQTKPAFRDKEWHKKYDQTLKEINEQTKRNPRNFKDLAQKLQTILTGNEQ